MLTILLRNTVLTARHGTTRTLKGNVETKRRFCISIQRHAQLPQLSPYDVSIVYKRYIT